MKRDEAAMALVGFALIGLMLAVIEAVFHHG